MKILLTVTCLALSMAILVCGYFYMGPKLAFEKLVSTVQENDIDGFLELVNQQAITSHFQEAMELHIQNAIESQHKNITDGQSPMTDITRLQSAWEAYFVARSSQVTKPILIFKELQKQLKGGVKATSVDFKDASTATISWTSTTGKHTANLRRYGIRWKMSAIDMDDSMPVLWYTSAKLHGSLYQDSFQNCCTDGNPVTSTYIGINLETPIDILDSTDSAGTLKGTGRIQIGIDHAVAASMIRNSSKVEVKCKALEQGTTGHYALPAYCSEPNIVLMPN